MLRLHRINYPNDRTDYRTAWDWMKEQPELYSEIVGLDDFDEFANHKIEQIDFALKHNDQLIAFTSLVLRRRKICEFELIAPARPRVRSILILLRELQREYFDTLRFVAYYMHTRYDRPRRLCRMAGMREPKPNYFEYTIYDYLRSTNGQETTET